MKIGIVIGRIGGIDGVALEADKWRVVLEKMGHEVFYLTGLVESQSSDIKNVKVIEELSFHHPKTIYEQEQAFFNPQISEDEMMGQVLTNAKFIEREVTLWLKEMKIDLLIVQNALALPCHLAMGYALRQVIDNTGILTVTHDHDFYWERGERYITPFPQLELLIQETFPLCRDNVHHVVINTYNREQLWKRSGMVAEVIPNVMDFSEDFGVSDDFSTKIRDQFDLKADDVSLFQITRIVRRKAIHIAIQLIYELNDPKVKLIITGNNADDNEHNYFGQLKNQIHQLNVASQVILAGDFFAVQRGFLNKKVINYSLADAYAEADVCTFFSYYEGFGNAFVEAVLSKTPIFVNNYQPVYWPDIGSLGFQTVMLEDNLLTTQSVREIEKVLHNPRLRKEIAEHNYQLGKEFFSFEVLEAKLNRVLAQVFRNTEKDLQRAAL